MTARFVRSLLLLLLVHATFAMGSGPSTLKRNESTDSVRSPSAAFGRLRIDSPRITSSPTLRRRHLSAGELTHEYSMVGTERSPLMPPQQRQLHRPHTDDVIKTHDVMKTPPLAVWIIPALLCAMAYAFYNIFIKKGSASIHPVLGGVILQFVAAILGVFLISFIIIRDGGIEELNYDWHGIQWSICAGIAVGLAEMISFFVSSLGVQAMQSIPIIIGGSVMFGTLLGLCLLGEVLSYQGWLGVALLVSGICLVGTDPAASLGGH